MPENEFGWLIQDELLRLVVITRDNVERAKRKRARKAWEMLIALDIDRVRGLVATFRFPKQDVKVKAGQVDDVVHEAYERLVRMLKTFRGTSEGEYRAAMRTCVGFACMDHCRKEMGIEQGIRGSLDDEIGADGDERGRFDPNREDGARADRRGGSSGARASVPGEDSSGRSRSSTGTSGSSSR